MNENGSEENLANGSLRGQAQRWGDSERALMEMEWGRGLSELLRNSSEEMFLKTLVENPIGISAPSMEMLGFGNITQSFRGDSEELFNSWLMNGEARSRYFCLFSSFALLFCLLHLTFDRNTSKISFELVTSRVLVILMPCYVSRVGWNWRDFSGRLVSCVCRN